MSSRSGSWVRAILHAFLLTVFVSGLFYYWYAVVDRFVIFLYGHLGATAFSPMTNGRYWMAGLVAGGMVYVLYNGTYAVIGRLKPTFIPPDWWCVWLCAALPLAVIIPAIVMTQNEPTLSWPLALRVTAVVVLALALALPSAKMIAQSLSLFGWLFLAGLGLMPSLLLLRVIELPQQGLVAPMPAYLIGFGTTIIGLLWCFFIGWLFIRRHQTHWTILQLYLSALQISYLLLPLVHYGLMTPPRYRYISSSQNFFASSPILQVLGWGIAFIGCSGLIMLQKKVYKNARKIP